ncbi:DUF975 family protein [Butyrivibrio sp. NC2002]|uniref:DUF975 family protein n=1 Tax=Butyrivibrio sp. NC2002 TaxID=1410610 RepID=UPI00055E84FA|nr:DUF975 family protein [Butyrivibrio sp. NC2002]
MWTRAQLKTNGKLNFKKNYWPSVVASIVLGIATGAASGSTSRAASNETQSSDLAAIDPAVLIAIFVAILGVVVVSCVIDIFVMNPLEVGGQRFYIVNRQTEKADLKELTFGFKNRYMNIVKTIFLRDLFLCLWTCLFIIPGIIKSYSYRLVPYILAENPEISATDAITLSRNMMNGHKWNAFVLDLSFLGWNILAAFTCFILRVFYVAPYQDATNAELYTAIKENYHPEATI